MPTTCQPPWRQRRNVGVEIRGIEGQHVCGKLEPGHSRFGNCDLGLLQLLIGDLPRHPMIGLFSEYRRGRQDKRGTAPSRNSAKSRLGPCEQARWMATATANSPTDGPPLAPRSPRGTVDVPYQIELLGQPKINAPTSPTALRPHRSRGTQIRHRSCCCRAKHSLAQRNGRGPGPRTD